MDIQALLITLVIGAVAGFLAGQLVKGRGLGILGNIVVGILGAAVAGFLFGNLELLDSPILNQIIGATIGAVVLLVLIGFVRKNA